MVNKEIGRIIENPAQGSLEGDLLDLVQQSLAGAARSPLPLVRGRGLLFD